MTKRIILAMLVMVFLACLSLLCIAATHDPWDGTKWDVASPDIDQPHGNAYKEIYDLRKGVAVRINKEHETLATSSAGGVHKQGSARAFFQDAAPATQVDGSAFDSGDLGSLWFDSNASPDNQFNVLTATTPTWTPISTEVIAVLLASNRQFAGTLGVTGDFTATANATFNGGITLGADDDLIGSATSDITFNTDKFTVAGATGNTIVAGTLGVTGVATLGDTSALATSGAPAADAQIVNKKYVDDQIAAYIASEVTLSAYTDEDSESNTMLKSHAYLAATDGCAYAYVTNENTKFLRGYVGATDDPVGAGDMIDQSYSITGSARAGVAMEVAEGEYFEVTYDGSNTPVIRWKSRGTLSKPVDQD